MFKHVADGSGDTRCVLVNSVSTPNNAAVADAMEMRHRAA